MNQTVFQITQDAITAANTEMLSGELTASEITKLAERIANELEARAAIGSMIGSPREEQDDD